MLILITAYINVFYVAFGTRDNIFMHFGTPAIPFAIFQLVIHEVRVFLIRNLQPD
jgi:sodium/potassium-transporting ATPase subunit alpha